MSDENENQAGKEGPAKRGRPRKANKTKSAYADPASKPAPGLIRVRRGNLLLDISQETEAEHASLEWVKV